jgi:hypothetical protein
MSFTLARSAAGLALVAALAAGCGTAVTAHSAAPKAHSAAPAHAATTPAAPSPAAVAHHHRHRHHFRPVRPMVITPPAPPATTPAQMANPIPQGNGGDQNADNNGGPSDGDGNI